MEAVLFALVLALWALAAFFAAVAVWFVALAAGRVPSALHRFLAAYLRYGTHVNAFVLLAANPFPGFTGTAGSYPARGLARPRCGVPLHLHVVRIADYRLPT